MVHQFPAVVELRFSVCGVVHLCTARLFGRVFHLRYAFLKQECVVLCEVNVMMTVHQLLTVPSYR